MFKDNKIVDYKKILDKAKVAIGINYFFDFEVAMYVDMYLETKPVTDDEFNRICKYVKKVYIISEQYELFNTVYHIVNYLKRNSIADLERIPPKDFVRDVLMAEDENNNNVLFA